MRLNRQGRARQRRRQRHGAEQALIFAAKAPASSWRRAGDRGTPGGRQDQGRRGRPRS